MSTPPPPRRRRIAGESKPGAAVPPAAKKKPARPARPAKPTKPARPPVAPPAAAKTPPAAPGKPDAEPRVSKAPAAPAPAPPRLAVPSERTEAPQPDETARGFSWRMASLVALALAALAFGVIVGVKGVTDWRGGGIAEAHEKAAAAAATAGETIFSYEFNDLDGHLSDSKALMTPSFAKEFESIAPALQELAPQRKIRLKATVRNAAATECGNDCRADRATVLVFYDQARVTGDDEKPTVFGNRMELDMVERDGEWLVDDIEAL